MFGYRSILTEAPRPEAIRRNPRAPWLAVGVVCFGAFMGQLDASIVTLTFAPMQHDFGQPLAAVQWVSLAYLLALVALLAPAGRTADSIGRKLVYGFGFVVFTVGSAACGLAPSLGLLVAFRLVQAGGAAMLQANSVALVTTSVPPSRMRLALSVQAAAQSLGLGLGPSLGGLLTQTVGWRGVYWINVPVGCAAVIAGRYLLPRTRQFGRTDSFDWPGALALAGATSALLLALSAAGGLPLPGWAAGLLAAAAVLAGGLFLWRELRARFPLIPAALLRSARVGLALAGAFLGYLALFGPLVLMPQVLPGSAARIGLQLTALPAGFGLAALGAETLLPAGIGNRYRGAAGALLCSLALAMLIAVNASTGWVVVLLALAGTGLGLFVPANNAVIMRSAPQGSASVLGGLLNMARGIGTTFGIALVTIALHVAPRQPGGKPGPDLALAILAAAGAAAAVIALAIRPLAGRGTGAASPEQASAFG
ncbi:MAG TPA: MFS transporter [Streptosporangiaceae bacterium]|jgi:MFS family permease